VSETRLLLVEDDPGYARLLREALAESGSDAQAVKSVGTLRDALLALRADAFDIILLDLGLPDADGDEALLQVAASAPRIPIVVLSSRNDLDVALESMRHGAQEYLVKGQSEHLLLPRAIRYAIERKRLQDAAAGSQVEAERANAAKDEFLAMLGHELRNPLAPIVTALQLMKLKNPEVAQRERSVIERQVGHLSRLVDDLLDVSRITQRKLQLKRRPVDLGDVVAKSIEMASPLFEGRSHKLDVDVTAEELMVDGDPERLAQVVANLLGNAAKYTEPRGNIKIRAAREGNEAVVRVCDDGIGIEKALQPRLFEMFVQGPRALDRAQGGLGLGLTLVKNLTEMHGGTAQVASEGPGRGSEFSIRLPMLEERARPSVPPAPSVLRSARPQRILVVDDNLDAAETIGAALRLSGHDVRVAFDGPGALEIAREFRPEAALLDIGLPVMDGYELAGRLRQEVGEMRLIALTGYGQTGDRERSRAARFSAHLVKPVEMETLLGALSAG
jgi:signal transduction histidine kinase